MKIIGIAGTDGSGKDSLGESLTEDHGYLFISVTELLRDEARKKGIPVERQNLRQISADWRRQHGLGVLVDKALEAFEREESGKRLTGLAISSLRNPGEVDRVHELGGKVVWLDADPKVRYERIMARKRGTPEDEVTFNQFLAEEEVQSQHSGDEATLSLNGVKAKADIFIENNGNDIEAFKKEAADTLKKANLLN